MQDLYKIYTRYYIRFIQDIIRFIQDCKHMYSVKE